MNENMLLWVLLINLMIWASLKILLGFGNAKKSTTYSLLDSFAGMVWLIICVLIITT